jgi:hypothetical protein
MDVEYQFGSDLAAEPWRRRRVGLSGQELIPSLNAAEANKVCEVFLIGLDLGRNQVLDLWGSLLNRMHL